MSPDPAEVAAALRGRGPLAWLDAGSDADGLGEWSYLAAEPVGALFAWGDRILHLTRDRGRRWQRGDPLQALEERARELVPPAGDDPRPFRCGAIGWLGYELGRGIERLPRPSDDRSRVPDLAFWFYADVLAHSRSDGSWHGGTAALRAALKRASGFAPPRAPARHRLRADFDRESYIATVETIRERILAGDVYQVNLSQRFVTRLEEDPFELYLRLRARRPAPLGAYLEAGSRAVLSNSPELFLHRRGQEIESRPIKGTRPRGRTPEQDASLREELLASEKDSAELTMIVDLMRNDLGRVAEVGSVSVPSRKRLISLPTVHHLVGTVRARVRPAVGTAELLRATFPGGSITGCPKVRAMELIAELEPCRRGPYCGAIGWIAPDGDLELAIAIRTATVARGWLSFHAGGGVVVDSDPQSEYEETLAKASAWFEAIGLDPPGPTVVADRRGLEDRRGGA